jgi:hypothetical protein
MSGENNRFVINPSIKINEYLNGIPSSTIMSILKNNNFDLSFLKKTKDFFMNYDFDYILKITDSTEHTENRFVVFNNNDAAIILSINYYDVYELINKYVVHPYDVIEFFLKKNIMHELTHAYDQYRSHGKDDINPKDKERFKTFNDDLNNNFKDKTQDDIDNLYKTYMENHREVHAHFITAFNNAQLNDYDGNLLPLKQAYNNFIKSYSNWDFLSDENKKKTNRWFATYYHKMLEEN